MIAMDLGCVFHLACGPDSQKALFDGVVGAVLAGVIAGAGVAATLRGEARRRKRDHLESMLTEALVACQDTVIAAQHPDTTGPDDMKTALTQLSLALRRLFLRPRITGVHEADLLRRGARGLAAARAMKDDEQGVARLTGMVMSIDVVLTKILDGEVKRKSTWQSLLSDQLALQDRVRELNLDSPPKARRPAPRTTRTGSG